MSSHGPDPALNTWLADGRLSGAVNPHGMNQDQIDQYNAAWNAAQKQRQLVAQNRQDDINLLNGSQGRDATLLTAPTPVTTPVRTIQR